MARWKAGAALAAGLASLTLGAPAYAHHPEGGFDKARQATFSGPIEKIVIANPHAEMWMKKDGALVHVVLASPAVMSKEGLKPDMLKAGRTLSVTAQPGVKDKTLWRAVSLKIDGKTYAMPD